MSLFGMDNNPAYRTRGSYANPHATIAMRDIPTNIKQVMRLTRFYYALDPLLGAIVDKMSEYPITDIIVQGMNDADEDNGGLGTKDRQRWRELIDVALDLRNVVKQNNVDKYVYGISIRYLYLPFIRYCKCRSCKKDAPMAALLDLTVKPHDVKKTFSLIANGVCPHCKKKSTFDVEDRRARSKSGLKLIRMNPLRMETEYAPLSDRNDWYYAPAPSLRDGLLNSVRSVVETTEMKFLEAAYKGMRVKLNPDRLWVTKAEAIPGLWDGWGFPPLFRVLESTYFMKVLYRANEALAQEHVTPMRILTPAVAGDVSPQRSVNLNDLQNKLRNELLKWKQDPNHVVISPMPIDVTQMGGNARVMMVASEIEGAARIIACGMGCPIEMMWGGLNWSGASVSLRVLENHFINDRENSARMLSFLAPKLASYFRLPPVKLKFSDFKMADDVQRQASDTNLMLQGFLSRESVLGDLGYDPEEELTRLSKEHDAMNAITMKDNLAAAHMNMVIQSLTAKANVLLQFEIEAAQKTMQAQADRIRVGNLASYVSKLHAAGYTAPAEFDQTSAILQRMDPAAQSQILGSWAQSMPFVVSLLAQKLNMDGQALLGAQQAMQGAQGAQNPGPAGQSNMAVGAAGPFAGALPGGPSISGQGSAGQDSSAQPLPEQRPPQRDQSPV